MRLWGHIVETNWIFKYNSPLQFRLKVVCKIGGCINGRLWYIVFIFEVMFCYVCQQFVEQRLHWVKHSIQRKHSGLYYRSSVTCSFDLSQLLHSKVWVHCLRLQRMLCLCPRAAWTGTSSRGKHWERFVDICIEILGSIYMVPKLYNQTTSLWYMYHRLIFYLLIRATVQVSPEEQEKERV